MAQRDEHDDAGPIGTQGHEQPSSTPPRSGSRSGGGAAASAASWVTPALVYGGAALLAGALFQSKRSSAAERDNPPIGRFIKVDGTTIHYVDIGQGPPVVLLHGAGTTLEDFLISGVADALMSMHRVIVIDRPGYGYSARPKGAWSPERETRLYARMLHRLGAHDAVLVGHSYGVLPAITMALRQQELVRALVLIAGAYFPGATVAQIGGGAPRVPGVGSIARATLAPSLARAALPGLLDAMFEPQPVPRSFMERFPAGLVTRPGQLRATQEDAASLEGVLRRLEPHYSRIECPVTVICGSGDAIVDPDRESRRFADRVAHARLIVVPAMGHMVHHSAPARIAAAVLDTYTGEIDTDDPGPPPDLFTEEEFDDPSEMDDEDPGGQDDELDGDDADRVDEGIATRAGDPSGAQRSSGLAGSEGTRASSSSAESGKRSSDEPNSTGGGRRRQGSKSSGQRGGKGRRKGG